MTKPTVISQVAKVRKSMTERAAEARRLAAIKQSTNQKLRDENLIVLTSIIAAKPGGNNAHNPGQVIFFSDEVYVKKHFEGFGDYYGMLTKFDEPFYEVIVVVC
jgi:hypothetical protein